MLTKKVNGSWLLQANEKFKSAACSGFEWRAGTIGKCQPSTHSPSTPIGIEQQVLSGEFDDFHERMDDRLITRIGELRGNAEGPRRAARHRCGIEGCGYIP